MKLKPSVLDEALYKLVVVLRKYMKIPLTQRLVSYQ